MKSSFRKIILDFKKLKLDFISEVDKKIFKKLGVNVTMESVIKTSNVYKK